MIKNTLTTVSLLSLVLVTSACGGNGLSIRPSMYDNSVMTQRKITVHEERYIDKQPIDAVDYAYLMGLSSDYDYHGNSPIYVVMGYDPNDSKAKSTASLKSKIVQGQMAKLGMRNAVVKTIPVMGSTGEVVVAYDRVTAKGPENCGEKPGHHTETGAYGNYGLGCSLKDAMAKQIAYPSDLTGKSSTDMGAWQADRMASSVDRGVNTGEPAPFVPSYILSELAGNTTQ